MFSGQRKKEALGRGTVKLLPRNLLSCVCDHVRSRSLFILPIYTKYSQVVCVLFSHTLEGAAEMLCPT